MAGAFTSPSSMEDVVLGSCRHYGALDDSKFGAPMPWVGMYVALASFFCAVLIVADIVDGLRMKKYWIPSKWFTFNSATLTILGVATKLPSDLSTAMPGLGDQLTKLGGLVLVCVAIGHASRSMVAMEGVSGATIFSNMTALGIIVITLFVDVWIQISTGVVVEYVGWYKVYSVLMLVLYVIAVWYSLSGTSMVMMFGKELYDKLRATCHATLVSHKYSTDKLRECITRYWLAALFCSPGSPNYRIASSSISAAISAGMGMVFMVAAAIQTFQAQGHSNSWQCFMRSDYKWSGAFILVFQYIGILAGTASCLLHSIPSLLNPKPVEFGDVTSCIVFCGGYRELMNYPLPFTLRRKWVAKVAHAIKKAVMTVFIIVQCVTQCPFMTIIAVLLLLKRGVLVLCHGRNSLSATSTGAENFPTSVVSRKSLDSLLKSASDLNHKWFRIGTRYKSATLLRFLDQYLPPSRKGFPLVKQAIHNHHHLGEDPQDEKTCCWSLTIATLATIVRATTPSDQLTHFMEAVEAAIAYAFIVDENFPLEHNKSAALMMSAKVVWDALNLHDVWFGLNLKKATITARNPIQVIKLLAERADILIGRDGQIDSVPDWWLSTTAAAACMRDTTSKLLVTVPCEQKTSNGNGADNNYVPPERVLWDVVGACLLNLPDAIMNKLNKGIPHSRDKKARDAIFILGQAENIIDWLQVRNNIHYSPFIGMEYINNWAGQTA